MALQIHGRFGEASEAGNLEVMFSYRRRCRGRVGGRDMDMTECRSRHVCLVHLVFSFGLAGWLNIFLFSGRFFFYGLLWAC